MNAYAVRHALSRHPNEKEQIMQVEEKVQALIEKVQAGKLHDYLQQIDGTDFGVYIPVYEDRGIIKMLLKGYSQTERNLVVSVSKKEDEKPSDALPVGWVGSLNSKDSRCKHGDGSSCKHCTSHGGPTTNCTKHARINDGELLDAPELDYQNAIKQIEGKDDLLKSLAEENFGISLLHGHSNEFMFTQLPEGYVSVISNGVTTFRKDSDVAKDPSFVPNIWRSINGRLHIAGGYSQIADS